MKRNTLFVSMTAVVFLGALMIAEAEITEEEVARLGKDLTPLGGEMAGNADGTIPKYEGGITKPVLGYKSGDHHPDPFADDDVLFTINAGNINQYADKLTDGHQALLRQYPDTYKMPVYPTRRSASVPKHRSDKVREFATRIKLVNEGNGVNIYAGCIPFPIPKNGLEVIWNHLLRYRGVTGIRKVGQAAPTRSGKYTLVQLEENWLWPYQASGKAVDKGNNILCYFEQKITSPARLAGTILMVHETLDQVVQPRKAWSYNTGQRRVRRAPNVAYDNPGTASDGMRTTDQLDMFNGSPDRYDWKLLGKKEMYVPYNSYKLHSDKLKVSDIIKPLHINQDLTRYELHRVWVVDASLKSGKRHIYKKRRFYIDEDSWSVLSVDQYDNQDRMWRVSEAHSINYYDLLSFFTTLDVHTDILSGRYLAHGLDNENDMYDFEYQTKASDYTPASLRRRGRR
ncbi:MAG TPA: DUF1329 domain-containing protein [Verrucomicrobiales bacterium]|nr:outer membrane lipoprotein-sorting protein [Verrucomicrobiales bacterium]MED6315004.1 DUF1329 domain-containing protein [Verrucomicrobiota bacterium]MEE2942543.1 DUF1329 domain-containing protein [Verrucomicrobiota bacterium]HAH97818.1 DUF1329 domain-containing protein [Verrucomicrobiales bacterium]